MRHLGTDINYQVLENLYAELKEKVDFYFDSPVDSVAAVDGGYEISSNGQTYSCENVLFLWVEAEANGWSGFAGI